MSALITRKKLAATTIAMMVVFALSGCDGNIDEEVDSSAIMNKRVQVDCYNDQTEVMQAYDDVLTHTLRDGSCGTSIEAEAEETERLNILAKAEKVYALALVAHDEAIAAKIHNLTDSNAILAEVVTYFCQTVPMTDETSEIDALTQATESVYTHYWRADGLEVWPYYYGDALDRFGCRTGMMSPKDYWHDDMHNPIEPPTDVPRSNK